MTSSVGRRYGYHIDMSDVITEVTPAWLAFARENSAVDLTAERVTGRSLWEFILGAETKQLYKTVFDRVRTDLTRIVVPFRCDSPTLRRFMRLEITRCPDAAIQLEGIVHRVEPCCYDPLFDCRATRSDKLLTVCSCCKRALVEPRGWLDIDDAVVVLKLSQQQGVPRLQQAVCPNCVLPAVS